MGALSRPSRLPPPDGSEWGRRVRRALVAALLLVLTAIALPEHYSLEEGGGETTILVPAITPFLRVVLVVAAVLLVVGLVVLRATLLGAEKSAKGTRSRWRFVALLLVAAALWATFSVWRQGQITQEEGRPITTPTPAPTATPAERDGPRAELSEPLGYAVGIILLLAMAGLATSLYLASRRPRGSDEAALDRDLAAGVEAAVADLETIVDPRTAVIACYSRMEAVAAAAGVARRAADTRFELLARLLVERRVPETSARRLTQLFEEAKFSTREIDETMRLDALNALLDVRTNLGREAVPA